ncbi:unnamed protein product [Diatraea saccharalis]|uniref:Uncharacterized protein n=1 Tax=Diatraea saccharalis TaxID=40085 RepID=A0A9N9R4Y3_9NEOP|nr:unnamed protein product [Diatraea saccharalis]
MEDQNITVRRNKAVVNESLNTSFLNTSFLSTGSDYQSKSLPDLSSGHINTEEIDELKAEIKELRTKLQVAHLEIEKISLENIELKKIRASHRSVVCRVTVSQCRENETDALCETERPLPPYAAINDKSHR